MKNWNMRICAVFILASSALQLDLFSKISWGFVLYTSQKSAFADITFRRIPRWSYQDFQLDPSLRVLRAKTWEKLGWCASNSHLSLWSGAVDALHIFSRHCASRLQHRVQKIHNSLLRLLEAGENWHKTRQTRLRSLCPDGKRQILSGHQKLYQRSGV